MTDAIVIDHVTKRYAGHTAVRDVSIVVPRGGVFGLLGPNGAGKTTTIRMILDVIAPDEGKITVLDAPASRNLSARIGFLPEERGLYKKMRVLDHLVFLAEVKGVSHRTARARSAEWLDRMGLGDWSARRVEDLSKGMQQKVQFIGALLHEPELVILDEPFSGLDPVNSQAMKDVVVEFARRGRTVLFSTHIMEQAERMCDRIAILARGQKVVDGRLADIKRDFGGHHVAVTFTRNAERARAVLADRALVARADDYGTTAELELAPAADSDALLRALVTADIGIGRFEIVEPSLHTIFIAKVGADGAEARGEVAAHA